MKLKASAPKYSFDSMCEPSRLRLRSMYSLTPVRKRMNPSAIVRTKTRVETAQNMKVWLRFSGYSSNLKDTCQITSVARMANSTMPEP